MAFSIVSLESGITRIAIEGELEAGTVSLLRRELSTLLGRRPRRVEVDLSRLRLVDSSGVGLLASFFKKVWAQGGLLILRGLQDQPPAVLKLLQAQRMLDLPDRPN